MKKYLMTGMAALAICAAFTSCSKETNLYSEEVIKENTVQDIINNYEAAFIKTFGQPAANQDWGFGDYSSKARTRGYIDANGNLWEGAPTVGENEPTDVSNYVASLQSLPMDKPSNLTDFYVTHIWKGTDYYTAYTGGDEFLGSDIMDQLIIADKDNFGVDKGQGTLNAGEGNPGGADAVWHHIYDFNGGQNRDYSGNMLMKDSGTKNFAYWNSKDNKWHDRWIAVKGSDIDAYYGYTGENKKYSGYWYICFDYEGTPKENDQSFTEVSWKVPGINYATNGETTELKMRIQGIWTLEQLQKEEYVMKDNMTGQHSDDEYTVYQENTFDWKINQISQGDKYTPGNSVYTDWIIRLVKAEDDPEIEESDADLRIICEDLSAGDDGNDFDFNDVVIDVYYGEKDHAKAKILAAGGVLGLKVDGKEVHTEFSKANDNIDCAGKMINTNGTNSADANVRSKSLDGLTAPEITLSKEVKTLAQARDNIIIEVEKEVDGSVIWVKLEAVIGKVASKVRVGTDYQWKDERQYIGDEFKAFVNGTASADEWYQNQLDN